MKILLDENVPLDLKDKLKNHEVNHVVFTALKGSSDETIFNHAKKNRMLIITFDKDFLNEKFYHESHYGIIVVGLRTKNLDLIATRILSIIKSYKNLKNKILYIIK